MLTVKQLKSSAKMMNNDIMGQQYKKMDLYHLIAQKVSCASVCGKSTQFDIIGREEPVLAVALTAPPASVNLQIKNKIAT